MRSTTREMLEHAGLDDPEACKHAHPLRITLAVGRDPVRVREVVSWICDGNPAQAYVSETVPRSLLNALFPGLSRLWARLGRDDQA